MEEKDEQSPLLIHCIDLENSVTCSWIKNAKELWSYQAMAPNVPFVKINIVDIPIDDLLHNFFKLEIGFR